MTQISTSIIVGQNCMIAYLQKQSGVGIILNYFYLKISY